MENWQLEMNRLNKMRLDLGLNWNQFGKLTGKNRELLKKYFEFRSIPSLKVYYELKTALENEFEVKFGAEERPEFPENRIDYTMNSPKTPTRNTNDCACDCKLENGLLKRGNAGNAGRPN